MSRWKVPSSVLRLLVITSLPVLLIVATLAGWAPSLARAADICVAHPSDASVVCVRKNDSIVDVCDRDPDGHRAYARVISEASKPNFLSPYYDENSSQPGCANIPFEGSVVSVAVCVQFEGCSPFKPTAPATTSANPPPPNSDPVVYAAGDISCNDKQRKVARRDKDRGQCQSLATYHKIRSVERRRGNPGLPAAVLALGDIQYQQASIGEFASYERDWGPLRPVTFPALGNHEYMTGQAAGYWRYFDPAQSDRFGTRGKGWYAFNVGSWRIYAINSNCVTERGERARVACTPGSEQHRWLRQDMAANPRTCSLMFMHHPYWDSSKDNFDRPRLRPLIEEFWAQGGDVVLAGHAHHYERFRRSNPAQQLVYANRPRFRMFIVGTGGRQLRPLGRKEPNSAVRNNRHHGVLQLRLGNGNYGWHFYSALNAGGKRFDDAGSERCNPPLR